MDAKILETAPANLDDLLAHPKEFYIRDLGMFVSMKYNVWSFEIVLQDISGAGKSGRSCPLLQLQFKHEKHSGNQGTNDAFAFLAEHGNDLRRVFDETRTRLLLVSGGAIEVGCASYVLRLPKGVRVFSPFAELSRLPSPPSKWTVSHVIRALWNGQFKDLKCQGQYSDDYAGDAARNYGIGDIHDGRVFAQKLIEHPAGWWASGAGDGSRVSICCHHFDSNSFIFNLSGTRTTTVVTQVAA